MDVWRIWEAKPLEFWSFVKVLKTGWQNALESVAKSVARRLGSQYAHGDGIRFLFFYLKFYRTESNMGNE